MVDLVKKIGIVMAAATLVYLWMATFMTIIEAIV
jgi:hypothetical protein